MVTFGQGAAGPKVVLVQVVLNTHPPQSQLRVDGHYGRLTAAAVRAFQTHHRVPSPSGSVDAATWQALMRVAGFSSIDVADIDDLLVAIQQNPAATMPQVVAGGHQYGLIAAGELARSGQRDIVPMVGLSNGVPIMVNRVIRAAGANRVGLLRIYGHGNRGLQIVSAGRGVAGGSATHHAGLTARSVREMRGDLERLRPVFAVYGSAELHGCSVGRGPDGRSLLHELADVWNVPVTAGVQTQHVGRGATFRFEGPTVTAYPNGADLRRWAQTVDTSGLTSSAARAPSTRP
ncbi:MAG TPA: peptidoglycan-binding protein [Bryobacteraceae bacterium]|nr:peptidoglycan-binding protein [Bryobacteraceae bacterium]